MKTRSMTGLMLLWVLGVVTAGLSLQWDASSVSPIQDAAQTTPATVMEIDRSDDGVHLRIHLPGLPWTLSLVAAVPNAMQSRSPETHAVEMKRDMLDYKPLTRPAYRHD